MRAADKPLNCQLGTLSAPQVLKDADGAVLGYVFNLDPQGYVVISADDRLDPVLLVSREGSLDLSKATPMREFLATDVTARLKRAEKLAPEHGTRSAMPVRYQASKRLWERYDGKGTRAAGAQVVSELWVAPLIQSKWGQSYGIYNYYTPTIYDHGYSFEEHGSKDNVVCGCVATMMAQILRYYQWPQKPLGIKEGTCHINFMDGIQIPNNASVTMNLYGGDMKGGAYDWSKMTLEPRITDDPETFKQIGALCLDAGLSVHMDYNINENHESGASSGNVDFTKFDYASQEKNVNLDHTVRANLNARRPIAMAISSVLKPAGHAIVLDGYGRLDGRWYYHLNMGWTGGNDFWYNFEENFYAGDLWGSNSNQYCQGNIYRQKLQKHEDVKEGKIIGGRITDANGLPIAGVKVSLRKKGESETWQTMLVWNEPKDPSFNVYQDFDLTGNNNGYLEDNELPGAEAFRNVTDANGIWAVDKVANGEYEIVLEKPGLQFAGNTAVSVNGNRWGLDFIATAEANLTLKTWWIENGKLYLQFNRAVGKVMANAGKLTLAGVKVGEAFVSSSSDIIAFEVEGVPAADAKLSIGSGFLTMDVDGSNPMDQPGMNDLGSVDVFAPVPGGYVAGEKPAAPVVTSIARASLLDSKAGELVFTVQGTDLTGIDFRFFQVVVTKTCHGMAVPVSSPLPKGRVTGWDAATGKVTVKMTDGEGFVRVDYVPAVGTAFVGGEAYRYDTMGPVVMKAALDKSNEFVDITWSEPVGVRLSNRDTLDAPLQFTGVKANSLAGMVLYAGDLKGDFIIWREGTQHDVKFNREHDKRLAGTIENGASGYVPKTLKINISGIIERELGKFMYIDANGNDSFDADEYVFIKFRSNFDVESLEKNSDPSYEGGYDPEGMEKVFTFSWLSGKAPKAKVAPEFVKDLPTDTRNLLLGSAETVTLKMELSDVTGEDKEQKLLDALKPAMGKFQADGIWWDDGPSKIGPFEPANHDVKIAGTLSAAAEDGKALPDEVYAIDLDRDGILTAADFIWLSADSANAVYDKAAPAASLVLSDKQDNSLNLWGVGANDLEVILRNNGGIVTRAEVAGVTSTSVGSFNAETTAQLDAPEKTMRVWLKYTPDPSAEGLSVPTGVETIEVRPIANRLYDELENAVSTSASTGVMRLFDTTAPRVKQISMSADNSIISIQFTQRIYGNDTGLPGNFMPDQMGNPPLKDFEILTEKNFSVKVNYECVKKEDGTLEIVADDQLEIPVNSEAQRSIVYQRGASFCQIRLALPEHPDKPGMENLKLLSMYPRDKKIKSVTIEFKGIYNLAGTKLQDTSCVIPVSSWAEGGLSLSVGEGGGYKADDNQYLSGLYRADGLPSLPPPMFTNQMGFVPTDKENPTKTDPTDMLEWKGNDPDWGKAIQCGDRLFKMPYTMIQISKNQKELYTKLPGDKDEGIKFTQPISFDKVAGKWPVDLDTIEPEHYGVWYRDLDGDGRIDAVDLHFMNPYPTNDSTCATLKVGGYKGFGVYAQVSDPNDLNDAASGYKPPKDETPWKQFGDNWSWSNYPCNEDNTFGKQELWQVMGTDTQWQAVPVTGYEIDNDADPTNEHRYSRLRLLLDQTKLPVRTHGNRWIAVGYTAPKTYKPIKNADAVDSRYYDGRVIADAKPAKGDDKGKNTSITDTNSAYYSNEDETAGVYWEAKPEASSSESRVSTFFICDTFAPVMAWDGAAPVAIAATAWRATPYDRPDGTAAEYLDVVFSEPIGHVADQGMFNCGYNDDQILQDFHGPWGAQILDATTVRFAFRPGAGRRDFDFKGQIHDLSRGASDRDVQGQLLREFSGKAVAIEPIDNRYHVIGQGDRISVFKIVSDGATLTSHGAKDATTSTLTSAGATLNTIVQGGQPTSGTFRWYANDRSLGIASPKVSYQGGDAILSLGSDALRAGMAPGAAVYAGISSITVRNENVSSCVNGNGDNYAVSGNQSIMAPNALAMRGSGMATVKTPRAMNLVGPLYYMVKAGALPQPQGTSRIQAGSSTKVLGIDVSATGAKLTAVTVRVYDTSYGQFDPVVDLEPLADGVTSGLQLVRANGETVKISQDKLEWSAFQVSPEGLPYREVTLRPLAAEVVPATAGSVQSFDYYIEVKTSSLFNLGDSFIVEIPDDGFRFGSYQSVDTVKSSWGTKNGMIGMPFTDHVFVDRNDDDRWSEGDAITSAEDFMALYPLYDGGAPYGVPTRGDKILSRNGIGVKNLYYAKKDWSVNPETSPLLGNGQQSPDLTLNAPNLEGTADDLNINVSYVPGDDVWYDIGGKPGVYDEGIDIPLFGNADGFPLSWSVSESGARSGQYRAAAPAVVKDVAVSDIAAPSGAPIPVLGIDMQDAGRGFGPRYILGDKVLVEVISKDVAAGEHSFTYSQAQGLSWDGGTAVKLPESGRVILPGKQGMTFAVVQVLENLADMADTSVPFVVSADEDRDIQQPAAITGVRIHAVGRGNLPGETHTLVRKGYELQWNDGAAVDVRAGGIFVLNPGREDYLVIQVDALGGAGSEELSVYAADGRNITPFQNITGVEIMAVSDMVSQGFYCFSYDGASSLKWGNGDSVNVRAMKENDFAIMESDSTRCFVVVRRTGASLPSGAVTDSLFINQTQLKRIEVTIRDINGITNTHFREMTNDENSGISLWWDANADGVFGNGDKFVKLLETPKLVGTGNGTYTTVLTPDPAELQAWLSCPSDASVADRGCNFFVCVQTTIDMSYGDAFSVSGYFYDPTDAGSTAHGGGVCLAQGASKVITCSSITNTIFRKLTTAGQTADAGNMVPLTSIEHFLAKDLGKAVYMTGVKISFVKESESFDPEKVFAPNDLKDLSKRGIVLFADKNGNGKLDGADKAIECDLLADEANGTSNTWTYTLKPKTTAGDSCVPPVDDDKADHFIAINLSKQLPFGMKFYAKMDTDSITYNTGAGSAASSVRTDTLNSTINASYSDLAEISMVTTTGGLLVNHLGNGVMSGNQAVALGYNPSNNTYMLTWNGQTVVIDPTQVGTYVIGEGAESITVTFDPVAFFREDTPVNAPAAVRKGDAYEPIAIGTRLNPISEADGYAYHDANFNGAYDRGEAIVNKDGILVYKGMNGATAEACTTPLTAAARLSEKDGVIYVDTDGVYTVPWQAFYLDGDSYQTPGRGNLMSDAKEGDALTGADTMYDLDGQNGYLYYIDTTMDGRGYVPGEDIVIFTTTKKEGGDVMWDENGEILVDGNGEVMVSGGTYDKAQGDQIVFDPSWIDTSKMTDEEKAELTSTWEEPKAGAVLMRFKPADQLRIAKRGMAAGAYEPGDVLFISRDDAYHAPNVTWNFRADKSRVVRRYEETSPAPFNTAAAAMKAVLGFDLANSGAKDVQLTSLKLTFQNVHNFVQADLRPLAADETSGVQLWRDADGNGVFDSKVDELVTLSEQPVWGFDTENAYVTLSPKGRNQIVNENVDGIYDFFVVVLADASANNSQAYNYSKDASVCGDQFKIIVRNEDVKLNKTLNQVVRVETSVITIDSRAPQLDGEIVVADTDRDGFLETLMMSFDEPLRPGMLEDTGIWNIVDQSSKAKLTVVKAVLATDEKTVTLTLNANDILSTTGDQKISVSYNERNALLDWAGNPVPFDEQTVVADHVAPMVLHSGMAVANSRYRADQIAKASLFFFDRNGDGAWTEGEDIWTAGEAYDGPAQRVWNGGNAWTTEVGAAGKGLNAFYCDSNENGSWDRGEFLWINRSDLQDENGVETVGYEKVAAGDTLSDVMVPQNRTEEVEVLDSDLNGRIDALKVTFSEKVKDSTLDGYVASKDSFETTKWMLAERSALIVHRKGLKGLDDAQDNHVLYFSFAEGTVEDTQLVPVLTVSGETLADLNGNRLNSGSAYGAGDIVLADHAKPVLMGAESSARVTKDGKLPVGTTLTFTFSESLKTYGEDVLADFLIRKNGNDYEALSSKTAEVKDNQVIVTFAEDSGAWALSGVTLQVSPAATGLGDAVGNGLAAAKDVPIAGIDAEDPLVIQSPAADELVRYQEPDKTVTVKIHFGDFAPELVENGTLTVTDSEGKAVYEMTSETLADFSTDEGGLGHAITLTTDETAVTRYFLNLKLTVKGVSKTFTQVFYFGQLNDIKTYELMVNDGKGADVDEVLSTDGSLTANWSDFAAQNGMPAADRYTLSYGIGEEVSTNTTSATVQGITLTEGDRYVATVTAYQGDVIIARATSNGVTAVAELKDTEAPVITAVNDGEGADVDTIRDLNRVAANWKATDNSGIASYQYRLVRGGNDVAWTEEATKLSIGREMFAHAVVGDKLYVIGGYKDVALKNVDVFDSKEGTWSAAPSLNDARYDFAMAQLPDGRLLVAGGRGAHENVLSSVEIFDGSAWKTQAYALPEACYGMKAVVAADGKVLLIGGTDEADGIMNEILELDVATGVVTPVGTLSSDRYNFAVAVQRRTTGMAIVVAGGLDFEGKPSGTVDVIARDGDSYKVSSVHMAVPRSGFATAVVPDSANQTDAVWFIGGVDRDYAAMSSVEALDAKGVMKALAPMTHARGYAAALWLPASECVLVTGGVSDGSAITESCGRAGSEWQDGSSLNQSAGRQFHGMALVGDTGKVMAFGGYADGMYLSTSESRSDLEIILDWTETDKTFVSLAQPGLVEGARYSFQVRATDLKGNVSNIVSSDGAVVDTQDVTVAFGEGAPAMGAKTALRDYSITVTGVNVYEYRFALDGEDLDAAAWTSVTKPMELKDVAIGSHTLRVMGRSKGSKVQAIATELTWTVEEPMAKVASGLPEEGMSTYEVQPAIAVTGNDCNKYSWQLTKNGVAGPWNGPVRIDSAITFAEPLALGDYTLTLKGYLNGAAGVETTRSWSIVAPSVKLAFAPELAVYEGLVAQAPSIKVTVTEVAGLGKMDVFRYALSRDGQVVAGGDDADHNLADGLNLAKLPAGAYKLEVLSHDIVSGAWSKVPVTAAFTIRLAMAEIVSGVPAEPTTDTNFTVGISLNGLKRAAYSMDGGAEIAIDDTVASLPFAGLAVGTHTLKLWGIGADGVRQAEPAVAVFNVKSNLPSGDRLTAEMVAGKPEQALADGDVTFTLTFSDVLMGAPSAADFTVRNGAISAIEADASDAKVYRVTVTPSLAEGLVADHVALSLKANVVFASGNGNGNAASNEAVTLVFADKVATFSPVACAVTADGTIGEPLTAEGIALNDSFTVKVMVKTSQTFQGGDLSLMFDSSLYQPVFATAKVKDENGLDTAEDAKDWKGNAYPDPTKIIAAPYNKGKQCIAEWIYDGDTIVGLRLGGSALVGEVAPATEPVEYAFLTFKGIAATAEGAVTLKASEDGSGILLDEIGLLKSDSAALAYEAVTVPVVFTPAELTWSCNKAEAAEADSYALTFNLSYALEEALTITVDGLGDVELPAKETTVTKDITVEDDKLLTGDQVKTYAISAVSRPELVTLKAEPIGVTHLDNDAQIALTAQPASVKEGESAIVTASLPEGVVASADVALTLTLGGNAVMNTDYTLDGDFTIRANGNAVTITVSTYADGIVNEAARTVEVGVSDLSVGAVTPKAFTAPAAAVIEITNSDAKPGDIASNDGVADGKVDQTDLSFLLSFMDTRVADAPQPALAARADLDHNGVVDYRDLVMLLSYMDSNTAQRTVRSLADLNRSITLYLTADKQWIKVGDTVTVTLYAAANFMDYAMSSSYGRILFDSSKLEFVDDGTKDRLNPAFNLEPKVEVNEAGVLIGGSAYPSTLGLDGQAIEVGSVIFKVVKADADITLSMSDFTGGTLSGGISTGAQNLSMNLAEPLVLRVGEPEVRPFRMALTSKRHTRSLSRAELVLGMEAGATLGPDAGLDTPAAPAMEGVYDVRFIATEDVHLKHDVRGLSNRETWTAQVTVPAGEQLVLDWSINASAGQYSMPECFTFTLERGESVVDMSQASEKSMVFDGGETGLVETFRIRVESKDAKDCTLTYELMPGWNLVGIAFELDTESAAKFDAFRTMRFDNVSQAYVDHNAGEAKTLLPGQALWVYAKEAQSLKVTGYSAPSTAVTVKKGWNMITPIMRPGSTLVADPSSEFSEAPVIWVWTEDGYRWLENGHYFNYGTGLWFYSPEETVLWHK